jgi:hypothetical protein
VMAIGKGLQDELPHAPASCPTGPLKEISISARLGPS